MEENGKLTLQQAHEDAAEILDCFIGRCHKPKPLLQKPVMIPCKSAPVVNFHQMNRAAVPRSVRALCAFSADFDLGPTNVDDEDIADSGDQPQIDIQSVIEKPQTEMTDTEKEMIVEHVTTRLEEIAEETEALLTLRSPKLPVPLEPLQGEKDLAANPYKDLALLLRTKGDDLHINNPELTGKVMEVVSSYDLFETFANNYIADDLPCVQKYALLNSMVKKTLTALNLAGQFVTNAKSFAMTYYDKYLASWFTTHGGVTKAIIIADSDKERAMLNCL